MRDPAGVWVDVVEQIEPAPGFWEHLITGASSGIGEATAGAWWPRAPRWRSARAGRTGWTTSPATIEKPAAAAVAIEADIADEEQAEAPGRDRARRDSAASIAWSTTPG